MQQSRWHKFALRIVAIVFVVIHIGCDSRGDRAWEAAAANSSRVALRRMGEALEKYRTEQGKFPKGLDSPRPVGESGLSWRVYLLPYLGDEEKLLFDKFHLDEPWDSKHNLSLLQPKPTVYESSTKGMRESPSTCFLATAGSIDKDLLIVEVDQDHAVPWTKPKDLEVGAKRSRLLIRGRHQGKYLALLRDGQIELRSGRSD